MQSKRHNIELGQEYKKVRVESCPVGLTKGAWFMPSNKRPNVLFRYRKTGIVGLDNGVKRSKTCHGRIPSPMRNGTKMHWWNSLSTLTKQNRKIVLIRQARTWANVPWDWSEKVSQRKPVAIVRVKTGLRLIAAKCNGGGNVRRELCSDIMVIACLFQHQPSRQPFTAIQRISNSPYQRMELAAWSYFLVVG